jgi:hypothetical protein
MTTSKATTLYCSPVPGDSSFLVVIGLLPIIPL